MKRLKVLTALTMGIMASASGVIQVKAATYNFFVDFSTKEVANYSAFRQSFNEETINLQLDVNFNFGGTYRFDSCPTAFTLNVDWNLFARANGVGSYTLITFKILPDLLCNTSNSIYNQDLTFSLDSSFLDLLVDDDTSYIQFQPRINFNSSAPVAGRTLYLEDYTTWFDLTYDFGTTYLFNYFLSDQQNLGRINNGAWTFNSTPFNYLSYVYTTAGNDTYYIRNSNTSNLGTTRKKYAIDYDEEFFRGQSVGAGFFTDAVGLADLVVINPGTIFIGNVYNYYYLNVSNVAQAIVDAPVFEFEEEDCGDFLALNVGCFINNAFAYITNDAPIVSDAFTLLNAGIEMAAQTFGIIGEFADDNVFGVLILAGFGFIAVKWFLKND
jgi:hypothetical protein